MTSQENETELNEATSADAVPTDATEGGHGLAEIQKDLEKFRELALRSQADLDNYRKRVAREREDALRFANARLFEELLPVIDNFELGLGAAQNAKDAQNIVVGFEMVSKQLQDFLRGQHVETVDAVGHAFNPNFHEAVAQEESAEVPEGTVIRQLRKGYKLRDRLLRPATVVVSKGAKSEGGA